MFDPWNRVPPPYRAAAVTGFIVMGAVIVVNLLTNGAS